MEENEKGKKAETVCLGIRTNKRLVLYSWDTTLPCLMLTYD